LDMVLNMSVTNFMVELKLSETTFTVVEKDHVLTRRF